jgi:hypothetical protein
MIFRNERRSIGSFHSSAASGIRGARILRTRASRRVLQASASTALASAVLLRAEYAVAQKLEVDVTIVSVHQNYAGKMPALPGYL